MTYETIYRPTICRVQSGYKCKDCNGTFQGLYVFIDEELFVKGECDCSFWLVRSYCFHETFY